MLKSISPSASLAELVYGTITALAVTNTLWLAIQQGPDADAVLIIAAMGANTAWGVADAMIYLLTISVENRRAYNLAKSVRAMDDETAKLAIVDDLSGTVFHTMEDDDRDRWANAVHSKLMMTEPHLQRIGKSDYIGAVSCFVLSLVAAVPVLMPHLFIEDVRTAVLAGNVVGLVMMTVLGYIWAGRMRTSRIRSSITMFLIGLTILTVVLLFGG
ncbi:MAG: VIT family protein [Methanomassiliicoccales archaeon PtaU1.Bin124]|nr:MAG: VIT family protein [Methanomassiliicoccales archaeon PtaU1.Bin124]